MKRPKICMPKQPITRSSAVAKSPKEAAIHLVRLEFDASRLESGIEQAQMRVDNYQRELEILRKQRVKLLDVIGGG